MQTARRRRNSGALGARRPQRLKTIGLTKVVMQKAASPSSTILPIWLSSDLASASSTTNPPESPKNAVTAANALVVAVPRVSSCRRSITLGCTNSGRPYEGGSPAESGPPGRRGGPNPAGTLVIGPCVDPPVSIGPQWQRARRGFEGAHPPTGPVRTPDRVGLTPGDVHNHAGGDRVRAHRPAERGPRRAHRPILIGVPRAEPGGSCWTPGSTWSRLARCTRTSPTLSSTRTSRSRPPR